MSEALSPARRESIVLPLIAGIFSGLLYGTAILGFAFLLPIQVSFGRHGRKAGIIAASVALLAASLVQLAQLILAGGFDMVLIGSLSPKTFFLYSVLPPAVLISALILANAPFWADRMGWARDFSATAIASIAALPAILFLSQNAAFIQQCQDQVSRLLESLPAAGLEPAVVATPADILELTKASFAILQSSFVPLLLVFFAGSRWIGNRISGEGTKGRAEARPVFEYRLPYFLVWPFLAIWTGVLLVSWFKVAMPLSGLAWNLAIAISLAYTVQGIGIASHFLRRWNMPKPLRICIAATAVVLFFQPPVGTALVASLPLLGVTEVWIPYRNPKGVGA